MAQKEQLADRGRLANKELPIHKELLLDCLRLDDEAQLAGRLVMLSPAGWESLLQEAIRHGVAPIVAWRIKSLAETIHIPAEVRNELQSRLRRNAGKNMRLYHQLGDLLHRLQEFGIPVITLKGVYLASVVYEEFALRPMGDIDLLVRRDDLVQANEVLLQAGYQPSRAVEIEKEIKKLHHLPPHIKPQTAAIELHWNIVPPLFPFEVNPEDLWTRAKPAKIAGAEALGLSAEDLLIHLCLHHCQHAFRAGLRHLYDIRETLAFFQEELDWDQVIRCTRQWGAGKCVYLTLRLAQELLDSSIPSDLLSSLRPASFDPQIFDLARGRVLDRSKQESLHPDLVGLWGSRPLKTRLTPFLNSLFPPQEYIAQKYNLPPDSQKVYLYYLVRFKDLFQEYGGQLWKMARRDESAVAEISQENILDDWWMSSS